MTISFNNFKKLYENEKLAIDAAFSRVAASGRYILGPELENFEKSFAKYCEATFCVGVGNGMEALEIALQSLDIGVGDEVITTSHSAVATTLSITSVGAIPVFVDIDKYYHLDASQIASKITKKTRAIMPVHLYGQSADMDLIMSIARKYSLFVIEDCAQAHGATFKGKKVGTFGDIGCFSFYPTKNLGAFGDAGALVTNDPKIAAKGRMLRNYGQKNRYEHELQGMNSRLDEVHAAILSLLLPGLDAANRRRMEIAAMYKRELSSLEVSLPEERPDSSHVYHLFVIGTEDRDALQNFLKEKGVDTLVHYPIPIHKQQCFKEFNSLKLPQTEERAKHILSLPVHPFLSNAEVQYTCDSIREFFHE